MKTYPIIFSAPMVRALLEGRKVQTRRIIKPQPTGIGSSSLVDKEACQLHHELLYGERKCPYGKEGDLIWVRENWRPSIAHSHGMDSCDCENVNVLYPADGELRHHYDFRQNFTIPDEWAMPKAAAKGNVPSIHMPRWASRLTLELTDVRVQKLRDISGDDALAEGIAYNAKVQGYSYEPKDGGPGFHCTDPRESFWKLWDGINGEGNSWDSPWVWALTFRVHRQNIDDFVNEAA